MHLMKNIDWKQCAEKRHHEYPSTLLIRQLENTFHHHICFDAKYTSSMSQKETSILRCIAPELLFYRVLSTQRISTFSPA